MIQHGAENIFNTSTGGTLLDDDIDSILKKGEERTAELSARYSKLGLDDLQKFSSEGSAYEWNGEDFTKKNKLGSGMTWINPTKRERKEQTYSIDNYYKDILQASKVNSTPRIQRAPKQIAIQEFQFLPDRLKDLQEKELSNYRKAIGFKFSTADITDLAEGETKESKRKKENQKIEKAEPLTAEEVEEKKEIIKNGFSNWSKRDFTNFIHQCARYGRNNYTAIAKEFNDKSAEDIERYSKVFWERYKEVDGHERYIAQIEAGEERMRKLQHQQKLLRQKIERYKVPQSEMVITYPANNSKKIYSTDEDRFILLMADKYGLDTDNLWEKVIEDIKKSSLFRFDWFFLSRTPVELSRRCATLLLAVTREIEGPNAMKRKSGPKRSVTSEDTSLADTPATGSPDIIDFDEDKLEHATEEISILPMVEPPLKKLKKTRTNQIKEEDGIITRSKKVV